MKKIEAVIRPSRVEEVKEEEGSSAPEEEAGSAPDEEDDRADEDEDDVVTTG